MNKQKLKYVPFNFFWCISSFFIPFFILVDMLNFDLLESSLAALYVYLSDVKNQSDIDYLTERIKKIENNK
jgi:hypothetical protein